MKQGSKTTQTEFGGSGEAGGSFQRGPRPAPRTEPMPDAERDRYGSPGAQRDAAGRKRREPPHDDDQYGEFLRDAQEDEDPGADSNRSD